MNSYLSRCALTTKYMSKAGNQIVCNILFYIYIYIFFYSFFFLLSIITLLFALNSTGRHAYIACNGVEPQKTSLSTSVTFNKICEGKSPINCFVYPFVVCTWPVFYHTKS